ncbi:nucleotide-binding universal stress UspA family protein [Amycolatopsis lexingtonensis]|uniref:Nucleotide-binding universal stress UspA family protein n=1 Tax=Amycolatopsis lexingtonensis TaxID=218822 RepID=A0ABR9HYV2_9PSEU|nr:universal stress protein [Amycolatopsis lexingtonensis]MBE1496114.1 nucleotide-binding universal stress UspA family protein [Amycolatopsis lexingtonensis]
MAEKAKAAVIAGVDASEGSLRAVRWAAQEAARRPTGLRLLHACVIEPGDGSGVLPEHVTRRTRHAAKIARTAAPGLEVEIDVRLGLAVDLLLAESVTAPLLVLGSQRPGGPRGALVGSVALRVAAAAKCPVVFFRGHADPRGPVLVGVDSSPASAEALHFAADWAAARGVPLVVAHAARRRTPSIEPSFTDQRAEDRRKLEELVAGWARKHPRLEITTRVVDDGEPARALIGITPGAQLIVVGSRGRLAGALPGSTGNDLLAHATCPVAVVH